MVEEAEMKINEFFARITRKVRPGRAQQRLSPIRVGTVRPARRPVRPSSIGMTENLDGIGYGTVFCFTLVCRRKTACLAFAAPWDRAL